MTHFHQPAGRQPSSRRIGVGQQLVELVTGGVGWVWEAEAWCRVVPGDLIWHQAGERTIGRSQEDDPYRCLAAVFAVEAGMQRPVPRLSRWDDVDEVRHFTRRVMAAFVDERFDVQALGQYISASLAFHGRRWHLRRGPSRLPTRLAEAIRILDERYAEDIDVESLAREVGWSTTQLHDAFRRHLDESPHRYLLQRRLRVARQALAGSTTPIAEVAVQSGFGTAAHFSRAFKQAVGESPSVYRRRHADPSRW